MTDEQKIKKIKEEVSLARVMAEQAVIKYRNVETMIDVMFGPKKPKKKNPLPAATIAALEARLNRSMFRNSKQAI